jgi:hypothetical protein
VLLPATFSIITFINTPGKFEHRIVDDSTNNGGKLIADKTYEVFETS